MKRLLIFCFTFLLSTFAVFADDIKFVQIDGLKFSPNSKASVEAFENTINDINKLKNLDFVVFTGNNITEANKEYLKAFFKKANKLNSKYYVAIGNRDVNRKKGLPKTEYTKFLRKYVKKNIKTPTYVFLKKDYVFIVADGSKEVIPTSFGNYRPEVIDFADTELTKYEDKSAVIIQHFPLVPPTQAEAYNTYRANEYLKMLYGHKNVKAVISGFGINSETDVNGIKHITTAEFPKYRIIEIIDSESSNPTIWSTLK